MGDGVVFRGDGIPLKLSTVLPTLFLTLPYTVHLSTPPPTTTLLHTFFHIYLYQFTLPPHLSYSTHQLIPVLDPTTQNLPTPYSFTLPQLPYIPPNSFPTPSNLAVPFLSFTGTPYQYFSLSHLLPNYGTVPVV